MIRKFLAAAILAIGGYVVGVIFGYRAAVVDYVENDAETIEEYASQMYPSGEETGGQAVPVQIREAVEEVEREDEAEGTESRGFQ